MRINLQVDVGIGDALFPEPEQAAFPSLLGGEPTSIRSYSRYLVVAEKFEAIVSLGEVNSRMKDFFDIWLLAQIFSFDQPTLRQAFAHTFARRGTELPTTRPFALTATFFENPIKQKQWDAFISKAALTKSAPTLSEACGTIWQLVGGALK